LPGGTTSSPSRSATRASLPNVGALWLVDPETGRLLRVDTSRKLRERFEAAAADERNDVEKAFASLGVRHRPVDLW
jgi:hypothetical protein